MTRTRIKICGLTRQADAFLAAELGADALGFILEPGSPRFVGNSLPELGIPEFFAPYTPCVAVSGIYRPVPAGFHMLQYAEGSSPDDPRPVIRAIRPVPGETAAGLASQIIDLKWVLFDAFSPEAFGGTGKAIDWELIAEATLGTECKVILAGGLTPDNVALAISKVRPYAVDVSSGVEASPGVKDPAKLRAFFQAVHDS